MADFGNALMQLAAATGGAQSSADYQLRQQQIQNAQLQNQTTQSALGELAKLRERGVTDPQQILSTLATIDPQYAEKAAQFRAQNPLAGLLQNAQAGGAQNGAPEAAPAEALTGDVLLQSLPQTIATQVKAIAEGKMQVPGAFALKSPYWQQMLQLVSAYDPSFDAVNYNARSATRKDFTAGKAAQNITALNTAVGHIGTLKDAADALDNTPYPTWNSVVNVARNLTGDPKVKNFETAKTAVADELERVFRGTDGSVEGIKSWKANLDAAGSPEQFKGVMNQMVELLNSRLDSLGQQYNQGMGTTKNGIELLSPKAQAAYEKLTGKPPAETKVTGNLAADNAAQAAADPVARAKAAGYTDAEIQAFLAKKKGAK